MSEAVPAAGAAQLITDLLRVGEPNTYDQGDMAVLLQLCGEVLVNSSATKDLIHHTITCLKTLVPYASDETLEPWQGIFSKAIVVVKRLALVDEAAAVEAMELFDRLIFRRLPIINPHFLDFVKFCVEIVIKQGNVHHGDALISKALTLLASVMHWRWRDEIVELKLIEPVLRVVLSVMCTYNKSETSEPTHDDLATEVVVSMSSNLLPEKYVPALLKYVTRALESPSSLVRRAAFMALAACCRGSEGRIGEDYLTTDCLDSYLFPRVYTGLSDSSVEVCHAALVALGQFSKILQPNISVYLSTCMHPLLFTCLRKISEDLTLPYKDIKSGYSALILICESLNKEILPYLNDLIQLLLDVIELCSERVKPLAMEALSAVAAASGQDLASYLPRIRTGLDRFLQHTGQETGQHTGRETGQQIQSSAFNCLAALAKHLGDQFRPYTYDLLTVCIAVIDCEENSELRGSVLQLCGEISHIIHEDMLPYIPLIVPSMIHRVNLSKEVKLSCLALGVIARSAGQHFLPYLRDVHKHLLSLLDHEDPDIRSSAATALGDLCCATCSTVERYGGGAEQEPGAGLTEILTSTVPKYLSMIRSDTSRIVCIALLKSLHVMLHIIGRPVIENAVVTTENGSSDGVNDGGQAAVLAVMTDVIEEKTNCQKFGNPELYTREIEKERFELWKMLASMIPSLASTTEGGPFSLFFTNYLMEKLPEFVMGEEGWANDSDLFTKINLFSEIVSKMSDGGSAAPFVNRFHAMLLEALVYESVRVRMDAVYGLGVLTARGGQATYSSYSYILEIFNTILNIETNDWIIDKVYAAVCRMTSSNHSAVPLNDYLPAVITRLPLKFDYYDNNLPVYQCMLGLYRSSTLPHVEGLLGKLISVAGQLLDESRVDREMRTLLVEFLREMERKEQAVLSRVLEEVNLGTQRSIKACLRGCSQEGQGVSFIY